MAQNVSLAGGQRNMPSRPQNFKKSDTQRLIRAAEEAGLKITGVVLDAGRVILQVGDSETPADAAALDEWKAKHADKTAGT
jgi:Mrp family chromosome partitioning ATPase